MNTFDEYNKYCTTSFIWASEFTRRLMHHIVDLLPVYSYMYTVRSSTLPVYSYIYIQYVAVPPIHSLQIIFIHRYSSSVVFRRSGGFVSV